MKLKFKIRFSFLLTLLFTVGTAAAAVQFPSYRNRAMDVQFAGGSYADTSFEDVPYVSAELLADLFGQTTRWDPPAQQLHVSGGGKREWIFTLDNPFVSVQGDVYNLTYPVRRGPERIYLPLHTLLRLLNARYDIDLKPAGLAATEPYSPATSPAGVSSMTLEESDEGTLLRVEGGEAVRWQGIRSGSHYLLRAFDARLDPGFPRKLRGSGKSGVSAVEALEEGGVVQLTLRLRNVRDSILLLAEAETIPGKRTWRVIVQSESKPVETKGAGTIILDAGHGGHDFGAIVKGVHEADINLAVTRLLEEELLGMGYTVRLTRAEDVFKTLPERPKFASDNKGDVFVSLHCNSLAGSAQRLAGVTGYVAYILREAESEEDKAIARRENQAIEQSGKKKAAEISPLDWIVLEHQLNLYSKQSEALAESIIRNFAGFEIPKYSTGARQAGFFVLVGAYMPAVLFEMGFLTHEQDRRVLASPDGQREIARRMAKAIDAFQKSRS